ncbi:hypothetical protein E2C01_012990 [Portunus trituberculatus]|uniref:Uncharacterized protein n=1 Tax=Portunus trituberculatus TaxID=210409 RepID=A0A5B7DFA8_PORTR|nr:hypothetical protein [Portunus trituberculatus]
MENKQGKHSNPLRLAQRQERERGNKHNNKEDSRKASMSGLLSIHQRRSVREPLWRRVWRRRRARKGRGRRGEEPHGTEEGRGAKPHSGTSTEVPHRRRLSNSFCDARVT